LANGTNRVRVSRVGLLGSIGLALRLVLGLGLGIVLDLGLCAGLSGTQTFGRKTSSSSSSSEKRKQAYMPLFPHVYFMNLKTD